MSGENEQALRVALNAQGGKKQNKTEHSKCLNKMEMLYCVFVQVLWFGGILREIEHEFWEFHSDQNIMKKKEPS